MKRIVAGALAALFAAAAGAADLGVLASGAIKDTYLELVPQFEQATGHKVTTRFAGTGDIMKRLSAGETYDAVIVATPSLEELSKSGKIVAGSRVDLVKSGVGVAVAAGAPAVDISSVEGLKRALLAAKSIVISSGPSGVYLVGLFDKLGIANELKPKLIQTASGVQSADVIAQGQADLGFQQVSELLHARGIRYLGPLPAEVQTVTVFSGGLHTGSGQAPAAGALLRFLSSPVAAPVIRKNGMEPG